LSAGGRGHLRARRKLLALRVLWLIGTGRSHAAPKHIEQMFAT